MALMSMKNSFSFLIFVAVPSLLVNFSYCFNPKQINASLAGGFLSGFATFYGPPDGDGSEGGACGYGSTVGQPPLNSFISAGSNDLYKDGSECGAVIRFQHYFIFEVVCNSHPACSGHPVTVTITDQCPGCSHAFHFDLSGRAFGALAKSGQADYLRGAGQLNIGYRRVPCNYRRTNIAFHVDAGSNPYYLAFVTEFENGDGDLGYVEVYPAGLDRWIGMQRSWGAAWKADIPNGANGPFSIRIKTVESGQSITATSAIPANYSPGQTYWSNVNF